MAIFERLGHDGPPNKYSVETLSTFVTEARAASAAGQRRAPPDVLAGGLVAYLFIKLLGADVIGDEEVRSVGSAQARQGRPQRTVRR